MVLFRITKPETKEEYWSIRELKSAVGPHPFTKNEFIYNYSDRYKVTTRNAETNFKDYLNMDIIEFYMEIPDRPKRPRTKGG